MKKLLQKLTVQTLAAWGLMLMVVVNGCSTTGSEQIRFSPVEGEEELTGVPMADDAARFAKDDMVRVTFSDTPVPPEPHEESIKEDGTITLPAIGAIKAEGRTPGELQKAIHEKYVPDYYKRLNVVVSTNRRVYYVSGQVRQPGRQEYIGPTTVLKAIASAGDFTDFANRKKVILTRADGSRHIVDCIKAAKDSSFDLPVFPGDKIEVKMRGPFSSF
jgi:protein involved in polysaccharide export with SLBB domain